MHRSRVFYVLVYVKMPFVVRPQVWYTFSMANGIEDLHEKNNGAGAKTEKAGQYDHWRTFQGREDAEMLLEKSAGWSSRKANRGDYDAWDEE